MSKIRVMDEILANKIAAGEVIERCVSIVKEWVENSIDAKSSKIKVDLINSGVTEIKVTDDEVNQKYDQIKGVLDLNTNYKKLLDDANVDEWK